MESFDKIRTDKRLLYSYLRGSIVYGTAILGKSDVDSGAVFTAEPFSYLGLNVGYQDYLADEKGDRSWFELKKWCNGLVTSNPTMIESLFIPDQYVLFKHRALMPFFENKDMFLTKGIYKPFLGFAISQISKARGLNKKIVNPIKEKPKLLNACIVPREDKCGSTYLANWLEYRGMKQEYCGLASLPNMIGCYELFYDWGAHFKNEEITSDMIWTKPADYVSTTELLHRFKHGSVSEEEYERKKKESQIYQMFEYIADVYGFKANDYMGYEEWFNEQFDIERSYRGMVDNEETATELRMSPILQGEKRLTVVYFNQDGFSQACRKYKEYKVWEKERNPARYESNLNHTYDSKNMCHCFRILAMGKEVLEGEGLIVDRREVGDEQFLLDVRNHKFEYEELISMLTAMEGEIKESFEKTTLPEKIDINAVDAMLRDVQIDFLKKYL